MTIMTKRKCDKCLNPIESDDTRYRFQFTKPSKKGQITKTQNGDLCHKCFKEFTDAGFVPQWTILNLDPATNKWIEVQPQ